MQKLSPGIIAAIVLGVIAVVALIYQVSTSSALGGPTIGTKDDMPEAMKKAYGGGPAGPSAPKTP
ncbi:hypothetical protein EON82_24245 [bacterium]|nr:MAG: hypothetical protein EON82_24245 [bacterium]